MAVNTYEATIRLPSGGLQRVRVQADNWNHARALLELQYGQGRVINLTQR
jgi:hypothetical protein